MMASADMKTRAFLFYLAEQHSSDRSRLISKLVFDFVVHVAENEVSNLKAGQSAKSKYLEDNIRLLNIG